MEGTTQVTMTMFMKVSRTRATRSGFVALNRAMDAVLMALQDTFRAEWAWQILLAPERISGMVQSMLQDYTEGGWLPMWKNIVGVYSKAGNKTG